MFAGCSCLVRPYAATALQADPDEVDESSLRPMQDADAGASTAPPRITGPEAQEFLSSLFHLPPTHTFPPSLALQILTHPSFNHSGSGDRITGIPLRSAEPRQPRVEPDNDRLGLLGRRAIEMWFAVFLYRTLGDARQAYGMEGFLNGRNLKDAVRLLTTVSSLGNEVGPKWGLADVVRWDRNRVSGD